MVVPVYNSPRTERRIVMLDEGFLRAIAESPNDNVRRLIYADWLEERGDERGEFLRLAVSVTMTDSNDASTTARLARFQELRSQMPVDWLRATCAMLVEDDVREAVFRSELDPVWLARTRFLQIERGQDPSPYLLSRFLDLPISVKPVSVAQTDEGPAGGLIDPASKEIGLLHRIDAVSWIERDRCDVEGCAYWDSRAAYGTVYQVELRGGRWVVVDVRSRGQWNTSQDDPHWRTWLTSRELFVTFHENLPIHGRRIFSLLGGDVFDYDSGASCHVQVWVAPGEVIVAYGSFTEQYGLDGSEEGHHEFEGWIGQLRHSVPLELGVVRGRSSYGATCSSNPTALPVVKWAQAGDWAAMARNWHLGEGW
jgi:uncharacterized protein (TIGR02996 family)